jgi:type II secretory pathway component PulL
MKMNGSFVALSISPLGVKVALIGRQNGTRLVKGLWHLRGEQRSYGQVGARLRELVEKAIPDTRKTLLVINSEDITYRDFLFPFDSSKKVMEAIRFETSADYPPSDYTIAPLETISGEPGKKAFLVAIIRRETLKAIIREAEDAGLKVIGITTDVSTLGHYFTDENESLVMEAGYRQTLFALYSHRIPILVRTIPIGFMGFQNKSLEPKFEDVRPLASEIKRTLLSFMTRSKLDLDKIYLAGTLLENKGLIRALGQTKDFRLVEKTPSMLDFTLQVQEPDLNAYASLLGTAGWRKKGKFFDFFKEEFAGQDSAATQNTYIRWGGIVLACFLCVLLLTSWLKIFVLHKREQFLVSETKKIFSTTFPQVTKVLDEVRQARSMLEILRTESGGGNPASSSSVLDVMERMSRTVPKEIPFQVSNLFWERGRLEIDGRTDSFKTVNVIQELLSKSPEFPEVTISNAKTRSDGQDVDFKITVRFAG